jgi:integrase
MKHFRARAQKSGVTWYYFDAGGKPRKEIPLGSDYVAAVRRWSELIGEKAPENVSNFEQLAQRYALEVIPTKANSTQATNRSDLKHLRTFFCTPEPAPLDQIEPLHIGQLLDWKKSQPTTANRLKRLFSHMFNMARRWGYTTRENPVAGVEGFALGKSAKYMEDAVFHAVRDQASEPLRDAMDLAYLTAQRPGDVLRFTEDQIIDDKLVIEGQSKTGQPLRVRVTGEFKALLERIAERKKGQSLWSASLVVNERGLAMPQKTLRKHFVKARAAAAEANPKIADKILAMWFTRLRSKAADDVAEEDGEQAAADLLGHETVKTTRRHYLTRGKVVGPTK